MEIREFVQAEIIVLVPVLDFVALFLRSFFTLKYVRLIVMLLGIVLTGIYEFSLEPVNTLSHVLITIFSSITQGVLVAGSSLLLAKESLTERAQTEYESPHSHEAAHTHYEEEP